MLVHPNESIKESSCELVSEQFNRIICETQKILERWDNRLVFPLSKLAERYLHGHLSFHLHLRRTDNSHASRPRPYLPRHHYADGGNFCVGLHVELPGKGGEYEFPVLVDSVHIVNEPEGIATRVFSEVRLQSVDSCQSGGTGNALYLSAVTAHFVFCNTAESAPRYRLEIQSEWGTLPGFLQKRAAMPHDRKHI